jgi:hypothetical protein
MTPNKQLERTVIYKVPRHIRQRAAAEPGRDTARSRSLGLPIRELVHRPAGGTA